MTREDFFQLPELSSFFPLVFASGGQWTWFSGICGNCGRELSGRYLRGEVDRSAEDSYRSIRYSFEMRGVGLCESCNKLTTYTYALHDDMTLSGISPRTGEMSLWRSRPDWFRNLLRKVFG